VNGTYTLQGQEGDGANSGFLGFGCKTNSRTYNNTVHISNLKTISYTGDTVGTANRTLAVSAHVVDPNDGPRALSGQSVTFALGGGGSVTTTTNASGNASANLALDTPPRTATLTVSTPATPFFTAASTTAQITIESIPTVTTVAATTPSVYGEPVTFSASVSHDAGLDATGQLQFVVDGHNLGGPVPLANSTATSPSTSQLDPGDHDVVARYLGDANYAPSTSAARTATVEKAATTTTLMSTPNPTSFGQPVTFTAEVAVVAPGAATPTGSVQFTVDGAPFGTAVPLTGSSASLHVSSLGAGNHSVSATYNGDARLQRSSSAELTQGVDRAATTVTFDPAGNAVSGQRVSFTVHVDTVPAGGTPDGIVQFSVDGVPLGDPVTLTGGTATSPSIALRAGSHTVVADYQGTSNFSGSQAQTTQVVDPAPTSVAVDSTPNPSVFGQPVTFRASVQVLPPGAGPATGQVQFAVDGHAVGLPVDLVDGMATADPISDLPVGAHDVTASFLGDADFQASSSDPLAQTVNRARTTTQLTSSANPSVWGQPVTLTAAVSVVAPGAGNPTGTITFTDGSSVLGSAPVGPDTGEQASITIDSLGVGPHAITASYGGDGSFVDSSDALTQTVHRAQTSTLLVSSANPATSGQAVRFTATVTPVAPGAGTPTGTVSFTVNGAAIGSPVALSDGSATSAAFSSLSPGTYDIRATYDGDVHFVGSSAGLDQGTGQTVAQGSTALQLSSGPNPSSFGDTVTFTARVSAVAPATGSPTGVVDFYEGDVLLGAVSLVRGTADSLATFTTASLATGSHAVTAEYLGNFNFLGSSNSVSQVVGQVPTVTGLSAAPNPAVYGDSVTLTATVSAQPAGAGTPTGSVTFMDGETVLGTGALSATADGQQAVLTMPLLPGAHNLVAMYAGTARYLASTSPVVSETVQRAPSHLVARSYISQTPPFPEGVLISGRLEATLTGNNGAPLPGETLVFSTTQVHTDGNVIHICTAVTDANGTAACDGSTLIPASVLDGGFDVTFNGSATYEPTTVHQSVSTP
jgi:hypothetical protein